MKARVGWPTKSSASRKIRRIKPAAWTASFTSHIAELLRITTLPRLSQTYRILGMTVRAFRKPDVIHPEHLRIVDAIEHNQGLSAYAMTRDIGRIFRLGKQSKPARRASTRARPPSRRLPRNQTQSVAGV